MAAVAHALFDAEAFSTALDGGAEPLKLFRDTRKAGEAYLQERFKAGDSAHALVHGRCILIDHLLPAAWARHFPADTPDLALIAVGGYGRAELHPGSDIDLMILMRGDQHEQFREPIEQFLIFLWDIGLEVGHSVRSLEDCAREGRADISVATNLLESRLLVGPADLFQAMRDIIESDELWTDRGFFEAKWQEQVARHHKFHDTAYNLEPNIKEGPGGLRDIHMIGWVAKRHFGAETLHDLVGHGFLTETEYKTLMEGQEFLWRIRFALHALTKRREDRLLFDHQRTLARELGYADADHHLDVEQFMQRYYRTVFELGQLNEMLLQLFQEAILYADEDSEPVTLNKRFQVRKGFIEARYDKVFEYFPFALLEIYLLMQVNRDIKGIRATTIRLIRDYRERIDDSFREDLRSRSLFMEIMRQPHGITASLRRMNRHGVLAAYLPAFAKVVGRMQYDLFHVYTVDQHTLFVVRNLRRFSVPEFAHEFPLCSDIHSRLPKRELLYLAGLFHDIAKGRGGDHSELGSVDAETFCIQHGLSRFDARLVGWLVRNHLMMSMTAQRRDISDPEEINAFAGLVGDQMHLDYLYLLTVADIRATNPELWNSWKEALLQELYNATKRALWRNVDDPFGKVEAIEETRGEASARLIGGGLDAGRIADIWQHFGTGYFLRYNADEIAWHTQAIAESTPADLPLVLVRQETQRGGTEVFIYAPVQDYLFALTTTVLDQIGLTVVDARLSSSTDGYTLDTYLVLEDSGEPITNDLRIEEIRAALRQELSDNASPDYTVTRRMPRQVRHFTTPTRVGFSNDERNQRTMLELVTTDRPGLLSRVGRAFMACDVRLQTAKIATIGARTEDVFYITGLDGRPLDDDAQRQRLRDTLVEYLDGTASKATT